MTNQDYEDVYNEIFEYLQTPMAIRKVSMIAQKR